MTRRRMDTTLTLIDWFCWAHTPLVRLAGRLADRLLGPRCPICFDRCHPLDGHISVEHYPGEE